jgi:hypothetical protein
MANGIECTVNILLVIMQFTLVLTQPSLCKCKHSWLKLLHGHVMRDGKILTGHQPQLHMDRPMPNDVIGVAVDRDAGKLTFYKNGVSQGAIHRFRL